MDSLLRPFARVCADFPTNDLLENEGDLYGFCADLARTLCGHCSQASVALSNWAPDREA